MKCIKCENNFPKYVKINGKKCDLRSRIFCLDCSPYKKGKRHSHNSDGEKCICLECGKGFIYNRKSGHKKERCSTCVVTRYRRNLKKKAVEYKGGKCEKCGYSKCLSALHFHHRNPDKKDFGIAMSKLKWERVKIEIDKCDLLCSNCHAEKHEEIKNASIAQMVERLTCNQ